MIKIFSHILLSSIIILSSAGMTINMHFCHDQLIDIAVSAPADTCCDDSEGTTCPHCNDESIVIEASSDFDITTTTFEFNNDHSFELFLTNQTLADDLRIAESAINEIPNFEKPLLIKEVDLSQIQLLLI